MSSPASSIALPYMIARKEDLTTTLPTGTGLDDLLEGGIHSHATTLLHGPPGSRLEGFASRFLEHVPGGRALVLDPMAKIPRGLIPDRAFVSNDDVTDISRLTASIRRITAGDIAAVLLHRITEHQDLDGARGPSRCAPLQDLARQMSSLANTRGIPILITLCDSGAPTPTGGHGLHTFSHFVVCIRPIKSRHMMHLDLTHAPHMPPGNVVLNSATLHSKPKEMKPMEPRTEPPDTGFTCLLDNYKERNLTRTNNMSKPPENESRDRTETLVKKTFRPPGSEGRPEASPELRRALYRANDREPHRSIALAREVRRIAQAQGLDPDSLGTPEILRILHTRVRILFRDSRAFFDQFGLTRTDQLRADRGLI